MTWWGWAIAGAILLGAELFFVSAQFYLVFVGSAAILVGLVTLVLPLAEWLQWALFALLAIASMVTFRSRIYQRFRGATPAPATGPQGGLIGAQRQRHAAPLRQPRARRQRAAPDAPGKAR
jgi:membrane protein implicated in regulation of membrane protease activity